MLDATSHGFDHLPDAPGVGYKPQHFAGLTEQPGAVEWLEVHAENYMGDGGRPLAQLRHLAERFAFSVHGVGLSIGGEAPLDKDHLARLKHLVGWLKPASFSEHLAWSTHDAAFLNDLLPLPYTEATLTRVADHIDEVQNVVGVLQALRDPDGARRLLEGYSRAPAASDVVLPDRSGLDLADDIIAHGTPVRILLSSGYTGRRSRWETAQS